MTVHIFRGSDYNAQTMSGSAGAVVNILDACLVNGVPLPSITSITQSGNVATVNFSVAHGLVKTAKISVSGATQSDYNGTFSATVISTTQVTYQVANNPVTATGSPSAMLSPAGWTKPLSAVSKAVYQQGAGSNGFRVRIDDTGTTTARISGYESISDIDGVTFSGQFPTNAQQAGGGYIIKSDAANTSPRNWLLLATEKFFLLWVEQVSGTSTSATFTFFGDGLTTRAGDAFHTLLMCATTATNTSNIFATIGTFTSVQTGKWCARAYTQAGGSVGVSVRGVLSTANNSTYFGATNGGAINGSVSVIDGNVYFSPLMICESSAIRALLPGIWTSCQTDQVLSHLATFDGAGELAGKIFQAVDCYSSARLFLEISDTY